MKYLLFIIGSCFLFYCNLYSQNTINKLDEQGKKTGYWRVLYENGKIRYEGTFSDGNPIGEFKRYYPGGVIQAILNYIENSKEVYAELYYQNGKLAARGKYIDQQKDSIWSYYSFYNAMLTMKENYKLGVREGESIKFYDNELIAEKVIFKNDKREGPWEQYYQNGSARIKGFYHNDEKEGEFTSWAADGSLSIKGNYRNNLMHGKWIYYDDDGEMEITVEYLDGVMIPNKEIEKRQEEFSKRVDESIGNFDEVDMPF